MSRPKLNLDLQSVDGNAFMLLGYFRKEAKRAGWEESDISAVTEEATNGDYDHLVQTLVNL